MEKQISIIIPTYNMEKYIGKCLDSLLIPELDQVEVLVVNDGSKDRSSEIAHNYADRYPDSIRVIDKANGNYGSCINAALPLVRGRYVKILDADDSFDNAGFSKLVQLLPGLNADVVFTLCMETDERGKCTAISGKFKNNKCNSVYNDINTRLTDNTLMHWIAYNTRIFSKFEYYQPEGISYTDNIWAFIPIIFCNTGIFLDFIVYKYLMGREGQTMDPRNMSKSLNHLRFVAKAMVDYYNRFKKDPNIENIARKNTLAVITCIYNSFTQRFKTEKSFSLLAEMDRELYLQAPDIYNAINDYNYYKSVNYKFYLHLRASNYDINLKIPRRVELKRRFLLHKHAMNLRFKRLLNSFSKHS